jgi:hypothetical protein
VSTLDRRIADGTITAYRLGPRLVRVDLNEVDEKLLRPLPPAADEAAAWADAVAAALPPLTADEAAAVGRLAAALDAQRTNGGDNLGGVA